MLLGVGVIVTVDSDGETEAEAMEGAGEDVTAAGDGGEFALTARFRPDDDAGTIFVVAEASLPRPLVLFFSGIGGKLSGDSRVEDGRVCDWEERHNELNEYPLDVRPCGPGLEIVRFRLTSVPARFTFSFPLSPEAL